MSKLITIDYQYRNRRVMRAVPGYIIIGDAFLPQHLLKPARCDALLRGIQQEYVFIPHREPVKTEGVIAPTTANITSN